MSQSFQERLFPKIAQIADAFGTPFQIDDGLGIKETLKRLNRTFWDQGIVFREYYALKANPIRAIAQIIANERGGFDCSSIPELRIARSVGAMSGDIMFTSNNTSEEEYTEALVHGGCILNLDDISFIDKVPGTFPELISFRLNPGSRKTGDAVNTIIGDPINSKYGVPIERIVDAYRAAQKKGAQRFGLHTMVCSNDLNYRHMASTFGLLLEVAEKLYDELGIKVEFVNGGGGLGIPYRSDDQPFDIEALAARCKEYLDEFKEVTHFRPSLLLESGRYITGPHGVLVNRVINVFSKYKDFVGVEVAMPALMRVGMYPTAYHQCTVLDKHGALKEGPMRKVTVVGSICENCDVLAKDMLLPVAEVGDFIVTHDTGAHGTAMGFNYNGRTRPQALLMDDAGNIRRTVRPETYDDLIVRQEGLSTHGNMLNF